MCHRAGDPLPLSLRRRRGVAWPLATTVDDQLRFVLPSTLFIEPV